MPQYRVNYFDVRGLAEIIRLILTQAGQEFVDHRFSKEEWPAEKANSMLLVWKFSCVCVCLYYIPEED